MNIFKSIKWWLFTRPKLKRWQKDKIAFLQEVAGVFPTQTQNKIMTATEAALLSENGLCGHLGRLSPDDIKPTTDLDFLFEAFPGPTVAYNQRTGENVLLNNIWYRYGKIMMVCGRPFLYFLDPAKYGGHFNNLEISRNQSL